ncbi:MAG: DEAD/DEAH box helicase [Treponemataceae bacterium]|nr:DEAD/DEAH box helicase [Treponemataceae bacterium]
MEFTELKLHEDLMKGIEKSGYVTCTPVQEQVLNAALDGSDLYVQSQTGTGKTAAYLISIIQEMLADTAEENKKSKVLIMVPTRELAVQVEEEAKYLASGTQIKVASFYGGVGYGRQTDALKKNIDIIVGTPGRVIDLQEQGLMDLSAIKYLVVDEADRMFDMGFYPDLRKLLKCVPASESRQTMLFSATLNTYVKNLAWEYTRDPKEIEIEPENITVEEIHQELFHVSSDEKMKLLLGIIKNENPESLIIFCNTKKSCELVSKRLKLNEIESEYIIGDLPQSKRLQVLDSFKRGSLKILVATDVAARGIDVDDLAMVINYDLPNEAENYVHRIGRTARAGKSGKAYTFCSEQDVYNLPAIERYIENTIPSQVAYPDQMAEDKSHGIYIKLDRYGDDDFHDRRRDSHKGGNGGYKKDNYKKDGYKGDSHKKDGYKKDGYKKDGYKKGGKNYQGKNRSYNRENNINMESLSFDERMKIYKEKYGQGNNSASKPNYKGNKAGNKGKNYKDYKNYGKNNGKNGKQNYSKKPAPQTNKAQAKKPSFLDKLKSLFGKKK